MDWQIFYSDGKTFSSEDGAWNDAPGWGILAVLYREPEKEYGTWAIAHQGDYYVLAENGTIVPIGSDGLLDYAINVLGMKSGRMVSGEMFRRVMQNARDRRDALIRGEAD